MANETRCEVAHVHLLTTNMALLPGPLIKYSFNTLTLYRSILTTPWIEFGGECYITCVNSGYTANLEFHTKVRIMKVFK